MSTAARPSGAGSAPDAGPIEAGRRVTGAGLRIEGVRKTFGDQVAIDRLDLDVRPGEFLSLLGPSGCGKTTLLRMIAGFETPTEGTIDLDGTDLAALPPHRRPVNTVFQSYALFPHMSVADNVAYGLKRSRTPRAEIGPRVAEALRMVRMEAFARRRPDQLSGGQQQRVALARALVNRPKILLLDEPMSALDRKLREEMQLELIRLHTELGLTFVFVTHDQEEALAMSDRIAVMRDGRIRQLGGAEDIYGAPADAFVAGFIGRQNFVPGTVVRRSGETLAVDAGGTPLEARRTPETDATDRVLVTIRPEKTRIAPVTDAASSQVNTVEAVVIGESFLGDVVQYLTRTDQGSELLARVPAHEAPDVAEHDRVRLSWRAEDARVFPDE